MARDDLPAVTIYTDGGCRPNPGPGGWGAVVIEPGKEPTELSGGEAEATNNRMELMAAIRALAALEQASSVDLYTDSEYLRKGITRWLEGWRRNGWRTSAKEPVANRDLWEELDRQLARHQLRWHWVKGHSGDPMNERADRLARDAVPDEELPLGDRDAVHLFTAAAYSGKSKRGGWAAILCFGEHEKVVRGHLDNTTPNRMHIEAAVAGLQALKRRVRVHLYTASDYLKDGATTWVAGWRARGWRTRENKPVSHRQRWQALDQLARRQRVEWHVVGRDDPPEPMERAKRLASEQVQGQKKP
jgi:ribonuclease HI